MKVPSAHQRKRAKRGFTLVELMVSIAILSIILVTLGAAMNFVTKLWLGGIGAVDNFSKARVMLSLLDRDIQMMVLRRDMAAFVNASGNPSCAFYTNVQGYNTDTPSADTRSVSLVQYIQPASSTLPPYALQRLNYGMNFSGTSGTPTSPVIGINPVPPTAAKLTQIPGSSTTSNTEPIATGVILFQWQFVDGTGKILNPPYAYTPASGIPTTTPFYYNFAVPGTSTNPRAVIISMLVLNNSAYLVALQTGKIANILSLFPGASLPANQTYSQYWNGILNPTVGTFGSGLPVQVRAGLQVFERYIPLPVTTTSS